MRRHGPPRVPVRHRDEVPRLVVPREDGPVQCVRVPLAVRDERIPRSIRGSLRTEAGAKFTTIRCRGKCSPAFFTAVCTLSRLSCTAASGSPTLGARIAQHGTNYDGYTGSVTAVPEPACLIA